MKPLSFVAPIAFVAGLALALPTLAQQVPAGSTGLCKDGTYTNAETKRGACRGHGGVKDWYAANAKAEKNAKTEKRAKTEKTEKSTKSEKAEKSAKAAPTAATTPATTGSAAAPADKMASTSRAQKGMRSEAAPGGGAGKVWVNTATNTYHCSGDQWYGKTKAGEYMSESQAKANGAHAARGKACG
jgi:hypothetical protein